MKKLLPLLTLCMGLCCVSCYDDSPILERLDALEKNAIASINEQINAIKASITSLEAVDAELKSTIKDLEAKDGSLQGDIDKLKEADTSLETKIGELKTYVDAEISNTEDWATATFATIEQYNEIVKELSSLKEVVESNYATLDKKIDDSIESIKTWVNEALKSYYTSEEVDELLNSLKEDLDALQAKLDNLLRDFIITFDDSEIGILAGGTTSVGYTITGATEKTTVKALGQNGWSAKVTPNGTDKGTITVTAPNPLTEDEIIVLVYDGEYRTIMSSINFVTGVVTPSQTAVELEADAGTVDITVTSNLNYKVSIPESAKHWISIVDTKATKTDTITFAYTECSGGIRNATISFVDESNNVISTIRFVQQGSSIDVTLTEAGTLLSVLGEDIYQSLKGLTIKGEMNGADFVIIKRMTNLRYLDISDVNIVTGGPDSYKTKQDVYDLDAFSNHPYLEEVIMPKTIKKLAGYCFSDVSSIKKITLSEGLESIDGVAFMRCYKLTDVNIPSTVTSIGSGAFYGCGSLTEITLPPNLKVIEADVFCGTGIKEIIIPESVTSIQINAFSGSGLESVTIPQNVTHIGRSAFLCSSLKEVHIKAQPTTLTNIDTNVFGEMGASTSRIYEEATLYIPKGTKDAYFLTDFGRFSNIVEE